MSSLERRGSLQGISYTVTFKLKVGGCGSAAPLQEVSGEEQAGWRCHPCSLSASAPSVEEG